MNMMIIQNKMNHIIATGMLQMSLMLIVIVMVELELELDGDCGTC